MLARIQWVALLTFITVRNVSGTERNALYFGTGARGKELLADKMRGDWKVTEGKQKLTVSNVRRIGRCFKM